MKSSHLVWNLGLLAIAGYIVGMMMIPKLIAGLDTLPEQLASASTLTQLWLLSPYAEGVGLMLCLVLCLMSFGSWAWSEKVPRFVSLLYGRFITIFVIGVIILAIIEHQQTGSILWGDFITFLGAYLLCAFPIVFLGHGWPMVLPRVMKSRARGSGK